jgi:tRNA (uracil-5-)-methyltransferase
MPLQNISPADYAAQLDAKVARFRQDFAPLGVGEPAVFASAPLHYRLRAEFRIFHQGDRADYAMFDPAEPKRPVVVEHFPAAAEAICAAMPRLRDRLAADERLKRKLFQAEFLATLSGELMISLIYHRRLDEEWETAARALAADLGVQLIGRSRGQKIVIGRDWLLAWAATCSNSIAATATSPSPWRRCSSMCWRPKSASPRSRRRTTTWRPTGSTM